MEQLPTVLLRHTVRGGTHYDWLLTDPREANPRARLWTARVQHPSTHWRSLQSWSLEPISPHRRHYLTYEGPVSDGRGEVMRVDEGVFTPHLWTDARIVLDLSLARTAGILELTRNTPSTWLARWVGEPRTGSTS